LIAARFSLLVKSIINCRLQWPCVGNTSKRPPVVLNARTGRKTLMGMLNPALIARS